MKKFMRQLLEGPLSCFYGNLEAKIVSANKTPGPAKHPGLFPEKQSDSHQCQ